MQRIRPLLTLAIVLSLLGNSVAALAYGRSCQEQMSAANHAVVPGDCCPGKSDPGTPCKGFPGKHAPCSACKAGFNCKSPLSYEPASVVVLLLAPSRSIPSAISSIAPLSRSPDGLWRPPRHI